MLIGRGEDAATSTPLRAAALDLAGRLVDGAWTLLASTRCAVALIVVLGCAAAVGTTLLQAPPPALDDPEQYRLWLGLAREKYGIFADPFDRLGLFRVFSVAWFRLAVVWLAASLVVSVVHRAPRLWAQVRNRPSIVASAGFFEHAPLALVLPAQLAPEAALGALEGVLARHRFHVRSTTEQGAVHVVGEKNSTLRLATLVSHAGLLVVMLAAVAGGADRFRESQFVLSVGGEREVGHGTGLTVRLKSFADEYYATGNGVPRDYRSTIEIIEGGAVVASGVTRVNHPFVFRGIRVHQSFYGLAASVVIADAQGRELYRDIVPLAFRAQGRPAGSIQLREAGLEVFVLAPQSGMRDPIIEPGQLRLEVYPLGGSSPLAFEQLRQGETSTVAGLQFTFERETRFTGLQLLRDPGMTLVWVGAGMVILGAAVVLMFPHRRVWARSDQDGAGATLYVAALRGRGLPFEDEFGRIRDELALEAERASSGRDREGA